MNNYNLLACAVVSIFLFGCESNTDKQRMGTVNQTLASMPKTSEPCRTTCDPVDEALCSKLIKDEKDCRKSKTKLACTAFLNSFSQSLDAKVNCTNTCDVKPFQMAVTYRCDELEHDFPKVTERSAHLVASLESREARILLVSKKFEEILDGALAEDLQEPLARAKKQLSGN